MGALENPYLFGPFAPVDREVTAEHLEVIGEIPAEISGLFVRNSPNPRFAPLGRHHWFDGDGMVHAVRIEGGRASYINRYIRTKEFQLEEAKGSSLWKGILEPLQLDHPYGPLKNTSNTDLVWHSGKLLSFWWLGGRPYELAVPSLETIGSFNFNGKLSRGFAAHPKIDAETGEMMFIDFNVFPKPPFLTYGTVSPDMQEIQTRVIEIPGPRLFHDIAITKNFTVFLDLPMFYDPTAVRQGKFKIQFDRGMPSRFGLIPRHGESSQVKWFEGSPCYIYHTINAYEEGNEVVLVACKIDEPLLEKDQVDTKDMPHLYFLRLSPQLYRWRFNLETGAVREEKLDDAFTEFPRINDSRNGYKARYCYNPRIAKGSELLFDALIKYDLESGKNWTYEYGKQRYGGEAVFVAKPGSREEDAGWVMTFVYDIRDNSAEFVILDASNFSLGPVARIKISQRVPIGFHACWVPFSLPNTPI